EKKYGKPKGKYVTLENGDFFRDKELKARLSDELGRTVVELAEYLGIKKPKKILAVGVGNVMMTADSLGPECVKKIGPIAESGKSGGFSLCTVTPGVIGVTGIESFDLVYGVVQTIKPDLIIAIDTLAAADAGRLSRTFQLSTAGLSPGGGVKNNRPPLNFETLNTPVIAVGVPLVIYALGLAKAVLSQSNAAIKAVGADAKSPDRNGNQGAAAICQTLKDMIVTVKDINVAVNECAEVISDGINAASRGFLL
ncbi:MAG: GPR endopeptidase, partial [Clostridiales bacterium]|nr:GPR endopeptidase [Clostridiales bacterium]